MTKDDAWERFAEHGIDLGRVSGESLNRERSGWIATVDALHHHPHRSEGYNFDDKVGIGDTPEEAIADAFGETLEDGQGGIYITANELELLRAFRDAEQSVRDTFILAMAELEEDDNPTFQNHGCDQGHFKQVFTALDGVLFPLPKHTEGGPAQADDGP